MAHGKWSTSEIRCILCFYFGRVCQYFHSKDVLWIMFCIGFVFVFNVAMVNEHELNDTLLIKSSFSEQDPEGFFVIFVLYIFILAHISTPAFSIRHTERERVRTRPYGQVVLLLIRSVFGAAHNGIVSESFCSVNKTQLL